MGGKLKRLTPETGKCQCTINMLMSPLSLEDFKTNIDYNIHLLFL